MKTMLAALVLGVLLTGPVSRAADDKDNLEKLRQEMQQREKKIAELENQLKAAKTSVEVLTKRNDQLMTQLETLTKEVASIKGSKTTLTGDRTGPMKATVKQFEKQGGIISLSIGKEDGLIVGQKLELFRSQPSKRSLGIVRILEVEDRRTLVRLTEKTEPDIRAGDEVTLEAVSRR